MQEKEIIAVITGLIAQWKEDCNGIAEGRILFKPEDPVVPTPVSANPGFFFFLSKALSRIIFSVLFRVSNHQLQIVGKEN